MGLIVSVLRSSGSSCTNGASKVFDRLLVTNVSGPFDGHDKPRFVLVEGNLPGTATLVSETSLEAGDWTMFGGNFAHTSDSRWSKAIEEICGSRQSGAVAIHDRVEY
jgi:hypothetical protein